MLQALDGHKQHSPRSRGRRGPCTAGSVRSIASRRSGGSSVVTYLGLQCLLLGRHHRRPKIPSSLPYYDTVRQYSSVAIICGPRQYPTNSDGASILGKAYPLRSMNDLRQRLDNPSRAPISVPQPYRTAALRLRYAAGIPCAAKGALPCGCRRLT